VSSPKFSVDVVGDSRRIDAAARRRSGKRRQLSWSPLRWHWRLRWRGVERAQGVRTTIRTRQRLIWQNLVT